MGISIGEIKETLNLKRDEMSNNRELTNELIIDDLMIYLGYNKKRDINVKKASNSKLDWEITEPGNHRIALKVYAINEEIEQPEISEAIEACKSKKFSILIITNGETLILYRHNKNEGEYIEAYRLNICEELSDSDNSVLSAISKETFDLKVIDNLLNNKLITKEDVFKIFKDNSDKFKKVLTASILDVDSNYINAVEQANLFIDNLVNKLEDNEEGIKASDDDYIEQIQELTNKTHELNEKIDSLNSIIESKDKEIEKLSGAKQEKAIELLNIIQDDKESNREYVGVLNGQLVRFEDLHSFVGKFLQMLYEAKNFEANQFIYNGDIFELNSQNPKYNDMIINNRAYEIVIDNDEEDDAISKLKVIFSHFDDLIFECKKIGTLRVKQNTGISEEEIQSELMPDSELIGEESIDFGDESVVIEDSISNEQGEYSTNNSSLAMDTEEILIEDFDENLEECFNNNELSSVPKGVSLFKQSDNNMELFSQHENISESTEFNEETVDNFENGNIIEESNTEEDLDFGEDIEPFSNVLEGFDEEAVEIEPEINSRLLVAQLLNVDRLIWSDEKINLLNVKYIGTNSVTFKVNEDYSENYESILCKAIDAILAIQAYNKVSDIILKLKQTDLSLVNNFIKPCSSEYAGCPKINGTRYVVCGLESLNQAVSVLYDICSELGIDTTEVFIYLEAETESEYIINNYDYQEESVQLRDSDLYRCQEEIHEMTAILRGDIFNNIVVTKNSLQIHKDTLLEVLAVKTKYLAKVVNDYETILEIISNMISEANNQGIAINWCSIGNVIGEGYKLISNNIEEVSEKHNEILIGGQILYVSNIENWQIAHSLIKIHTALFNNTSIAVKVRIDADAINFYGSQFETSEPSMSLAVNSFASYVASCVK